MSKLSPDKKQKAVSENLLSAAKSLRAGWEKNLTQPMGQLNEALLEVERTSK